LGLKLRNTTPKRRIAAKLCGGRAPANRLNNAGVSDHWHDQLADAHLLRIQRPDGYILLQMSSVIDPWPSYRSESEKDQTLEALPTFWP